MTNKVDQSDLSKLERDKDGSFKRTVSTFRDTIEKGGKFPPEKGRYHLYVALTCREPPVPLYYFIFNLTGRKAWAHRTLVVRKLKGLEDVISVTVAAPQMDALGWPFFNVDPFPGAEFDPSPVKASHIRDLYLKAEPSFEGRFTVPVLWDKKSQTIVNNESSEIIRILNHAFDEFVGNKIDLYPEQLRTKIDELNEKVYDNVNNGVYKAGFATTQSAYESAISKLFSTLDELEECLSSTTYLVGDRLTEADVRLYTTIVRFDVAYHGNFKCNIKTIRDGYPNLHRWLRRLYWSKETDAFKSTTDFKHIKAGYYGMKTLNPTRIIPVGPVPSILPLEA